MSQIYSRRLHCCMIGTLVDATVAGGPELPCLLPRCQCSPSPPPRMRVHACIVRVCSLTGCNFWLYGRAVTVVTAGCCRVWAQQERGLSRGDRASVCAPPGRVQGGGGRQSRRLGERWATRPCLGMSRACLCALCVCVFRMPSRGCECGCACVHACMRGYVRARFFVHLLVL